MKKSLLLFLSEFVVVAVMWAMLVAFACLWPITFLYLRLVSRTPVSDQISGCAERVIQLNKIMDAIAGKEE